MAEETVRRRTGKAKQFFREAVERGYCDQNPFQNLPSTSRGNSANQFFVPARWIAACIEQCPDRDWRTILALCRYGGLRCPSELLKLRWQDVDLPAGKMMIHAPKTEHHASGGVRVCPIFVELRPHLEAAWDEQDPGEESEFVINRYRSPDQNLRTTFEKIIRRSGLKTWPRLFQNLRASRETELMSRFPAKDVSSWLGNSVPVAMRHYAMATDESFRAAAGLNGGHIGGHILGHPDSSSTDHPETKKVVSPQDNDLLNADDDSCELVLVGDEGLATRIPIRRPKSTPN
ncbi:MAG: tyrosine-type recombinase/integrase [Planctomycetales bacterium]|nr:tyrosine-type recombinase/integrase [Planctomycetales bacterium]